MDERVISYEVVKRLFGDISDHKTAEIINSGLPITELEKIALLLTGDTDHIRDTGRLAPQSQELLGLLRSDDEAWEEGRG